MGPLHERRYKEDDGSSADQKKMREAHLRCYGHEVCSEEETVSKIALRVSPGGKRLQGKLKKRWLDRVIEDVQQVDPELIRPKTLRY